MPRYNPLIFTGLDLTGTGGSGPAGDIHWKAPVADLTALLAIEGAAGDTRVVLSTQHIYIWDSVESKWVDTSFTLGEVGIIPSDDGATLTYINDVDGIRRVVFSLQPADATHPGIITTQAQSFGGIKTYTDSIVAEDTIDAKGGIDSSVGPLNIGQSTTIINIGNSGSTVNISGTTLYENVTDLLVTDKTITINDGGALGSSNNAGLYVEEDGLTYGYVKISDDRASWELKSPAQDGIVTLNGGSSGIVLNQSTEDLLPLDGSRVMSGTLQIETTSTEITTLDSSALTFGNAQGTLSNVQSITFTNGGVIQAQGAQIEIGVSLNASNQLITDVLDPVSDQDAATKAYVDSLTLGYDFVTKEPTGFPNRTDSTVTFERGDRTLTISPTGSVFDVYVKGKKFTKTTETIVISTDSGNHYIYYDYNGNLVDNVVFDSSIFSDNALIAIIYWNNDADTNIYFAEERHGLTMDGATHGYLHTVFGARYLSGLALENFNVDGTGDSSTDAQFTSDQGSIRDEDLLITILQQNDIPILYREGSLWRKKGADSFPVIYGGTAGYSSGLRLPYNELVGTTWQLTEVVNNGFVLVHFFGTNDKDSGVVGIQGINQYNNVSDARNAAATEISSLSGLPFAEFVPIGSVVFETSDGYGNIPKARVRSVNGGNYVDFRGTQLYTPAGTATTHSLLSGLAGDDHIQYLLADGTRTLSGSLKLKQQSSGSNYSAIQAASSVPSNFTLTLPSTLPPTSGSALVVDTSGNMTYETVTPGSTTDIPTTEFTALNNSSGNVTGFSFSNATVKAFEGVVSIRRGSSDVQYTLKGIQKVSSWEMTQDYVGDEVGITLSITSLGQIQYSLTDNVNNAIIRFRAITV